MKRLVGILLVLVMVAGCMTAFAAETSEKEATKTIANVCLDSAKGYLDAYNKMAEKPEDFLTMAYHYYCAYMEFKALSRIAGQLDLGLGAFDGKLLEKTSMALSNSILDEIYSNWLDDKISKDELAEVMGVLFETIKPVE